VFLAIEGITIRRALVVGAVAAGLVLGLLSLGWTGAWHYASRGG
jgi:hypothetical protein